MFFLNLSLGEFLTLLGSLSGLVAALYLLDRAKKKKVVSTLRFWVDAPRVDEQRRRKRIREPWSLVLQLLSLLLLLLALAQLQWGSRERAGRNHVIVLDTSSWMAQRSGRSNLLELAKDQARRYVASLPSQDRVMLIRADSLATPVTSLSEDRKPLLQAIAASTPSYTALNLASALELGNRAMTWSDARAGEVVFIGGQRVARWDDEIASVPQLRVLPVDDANTENVGIHRLGVRRDQSADDLWQASVALRNYGKLSRNVTLRLRFANTAFKPRRLSLDPGEDRVEQFKFSTSGSGTLTASVDSGDALPLDDQVQLELPQNGRLRVAVYSGRPDAWQALLEADNRIQALYLPVSRYSPDPPADVILLDGFGPEAPPKLPSLWVKPPAQASPLPVIATQDNTVLTHWNTETELSVGLHSKEMRLSSAEVFSAGKSGLPIASSDRGPVIVAHAATSGRPRFAAIGFDPLGGSLRFEISTPLLFANLLRWLEPESLRTTELTAAGVGAASLTLDPHEANGPLRVLDSSGFAVPFTLRNGVLQLYTAKPTVVRIVSAERERVLSLTLPGVGEYHWRPPSSAPHTLPRNGWLGASAIDLWKWLAIAGALGLYIEWLLFGKQRRWAKRQAPVRRPREAAEERELVH
jgi:hypothetical protein